MAVSAKSATGLDREESERASAPAGKPKGTSVVEIDGERFDVTDDLPDELPVSHTELDLYYHRFRGFLEKLFGD